MFNFECVTRPATSGWQ